MSNAMFKLGKRPGAPKMRVPSKKPLCGAQGIKAIASVRNDVLAHGWNPDGMSIGSWMLTVQPGMFPEFAMERLRALLGGMSVQTWEKIPGRTVCDVLELLDKAGER